MNQEQPVAPLRLLSLDGGGVRGFSELIFLQNIMWRIQKKKWEKAVKENPFITHDDIGEQKPCDYFDLCGGTSTGGIIAILLFRMRLSVSECLNIYSTLSEEIFREKQDIFKIFTTFSRYDHQILEKAIKDEVGKWSKTGNVDETLSDPSRDVRRAFVTATRYEDARRDHPRLLRTYASKFQVEGDRNVRIWEGARATSAAPSYFQPITLEGEVEQLVDGGLGCNNPVYQVIEEARDQFPGREIGCLVSIGTGIPAVRAAGEESSNSGSGVIWNLVKSLPVIKGGVDLWDQSKVLERVASTCEYTHQRMCKDSRNDPELEGRYYRLNVAQGHQGISLEMWDRLSEVSVHTQRYIETHDVGGKRITHLLDEIVAKIYIPFEMNGRPSIR